VVSHGSSVNITGKLDTFIKNKAGGSGPFSSDPDQNATSKKPQTIQDLEN
jgi:hypothetical protein